MYELYHGNALDILPLLPEHIIDMTFADLPYGKTALDWDKIIPIDILWIQLNRINNINASMLFTSVQPFTTLLNHSNLANFKYDIIWDKMIGGAFVLAKKRILPRHENISLFNRGKVTYNPQMQSKLIKNIRPRNNGSSKGNAIPVASGIAKNSDMYDPTKSYPTTIISISSKSKECNPLNRLHPTQKPVELLEYLILTYTNAGDIILDPVMGSGTTGVVAMKTGRRFIGIEKEEQYFSIAQKRIQEAYERKQYAGIK